MTWLAPWALAAGALGMLGIVAAHLLSRQRPRALALATARFLPGGMLEATTVQRVPQDRWWMLLRLLIVALLALGAAQPVITGRKVPTRTVLLLDRTLPAEVQRTAVSRLGEDDLVLAFDTTATLTPLRTFAAGTSPTASLSAGLATLVRLRDSLALGATQVQVAIAARFADASLDPATPRIRALLRDSIGVIPVTMAPDSNTARVAIAMQADPDDPVRATALLLGDSAAPMRTVVIRRDAISADDAAAAAGGATVVHWPVRTMTAEPALQALTTSGVTWIAPFGRDSTAAPPDCARAIGWWADGAPAVWRRDAATGCILTVRAALPSAGDHTLSLAAQAWLRALVNTCAPDRTGARPAPEWIAPVPSSRTMLVSRQTLSSGAAPWLVVAALALAAVELVLRTVRRA